MKNPEMAKGFVTITVSWSVKNEPPMLVGITLRQRPILLP